MDGSTLTLTVYEFQFWLCSVSRISWPLLKHIDLDFYKRPKCLTLWQIIEYFLSTTVYYDSTGSLRRDTALLFIWFCYTFAIVAVFPFWFWLRFFIFSGYSTIYFCEEENKKKKIFLKEKNKSCTYNIYFAAIFFMINFIPFWFFWYNSDPCSLGQPLNIHDIISNFFFAFSRC